MKKQLRLDYLHSKNLKVSVDDVVIKNGIPIKVGSQASANSWNTTDDGILIKSLAPRTNTGVQPCGDDVPVVVTFNDEEIRDDCAHGFNWDAGGGDFSIDSWQPDIEALIKMQIEHDAKQADSYPVKGTEPNFKGVDAKPVKKTVVDAVNYYRGKQQYDVFLVNGDLTTLAINPDRELVCFISEFNQCAEEMSKMNIDNIEIKVVKPEFNNPISKLILESRESKQAIYTKEMQSIKATPEAGMLVRVEFKSMHTGRLEIHPVTYLHKTDKELCLIGEDGLHLIVDVEEFVTWHYIDTRTELEIAQERQIDDYLSKLHDTKMMKFNSSFTRKMLVIMQSEGMLAEIKLEK